MKAIHAIFLFIIVLSLGVNTSCKSPLEYDGPEITDTTGIEHPEPSTSVEVMSTEMTGTYQLLLDPSHPQPLAESALVKNGYERDVVEIEATIDTIAGFEVMNLDVKLEIPEGLMADFYNQMKYQVSGFEFEADSIVVQSRPITHDMNCLCDEFSMRVCHMEYSPYPHIVESEDFRPVDATMSIVKDPTPVAGVYSVFIEVHMLHIIDRPGPGNEIFFQAGAQFEVRYKLED